uniref:Uncharacterized protein n=1 Tax=Arundo donax TaxID=35708 RepID=A0A0A9EC94_ARUDO
MRERSRLTVSQTGSVSVLGTGPNPSEAMGTAMEPVAWAEADTAAENGRLEVAGGGTGAGEVEMGMETRGRRRAARRGGRRRGRARRG